jgi:hypothetical protein
VKKLTARADPESSTQQSTSSSSSSVIVIDGVETEVGGEGHISADGSADIRIGLERAAWMGRRSGE